ncbi:class I SAM-dependent methyltransferase [Nocardioides mangrovicus]|uniref:Class I SAM-dependent methyltransferase n=1 Tax=Nocardioides mangrovicus TaxID=2478913 RepID=A0A3L8P3L5_9ACTN|nr:class I SAM-dependent methyltransferase [Nocardioides mangrovicus]RLV49691.1 class I SAM-dependent methyltransferase [Nocardioides mangrovicus]
MRLPWRRRRTNPLETWFRRHEGRLVHKWIHYFEIYDRHFSRFRGQDVTIVEFGVSHGGSLQMWRDYFGPRARIYGIDIDPRCEAFGDDAGTTVFIGDQADKTFLKDIAAKIGPVDVLIEDGGHRPEQQIATFQVFYPRVRAGGVFLIEDLHTSYWPGYDGGLHRPGTFMEFAKGKTDQLNAWHSQQDDFAVSRFTRTTRSMHFYDSIVVFEKGKVAPPHHEMVGTAHW